MMKTLLVIGTAAGLVIAASAASAGTCTTEIENLQKKLSSSDAGMGPTGTTGMGTITETGNLHPPTDTMNQATDNKAASSNDVLNQNEGAPTDSETANSQAGSGAQFPGAANASDALQRARQFDQAGNEAACMDEIPRAKSQFGVQ